MTAFRIINARDRRSVDRFLDRAHRRDPRLDRRVRAIVDRVRAEGDRALRRFARRFDGVAGSLEVTEREVEAGVRRVPADVRRAISRAARNIERVAARQLPKTVRAPVAPGVSIEQRVEPLARVGCYVPGGRFPLPSSLLMTAIPARVAGVPEIIAACPKPEPAVMAAALEAGITRLFRIGGAHSVAALAYGTATIPRVDKLVGPGSRYVAAAKAYVAGDCAIDFYAGPTEIVIVAGGGRPDWIAADLVAQAEHDPEARPILITWNASLADQVARAIVRRASARPIARAALMANGAAIVARTADEAIILSNRIAPEHLVVDRESLARRSLTAGSVFVGPFAAQAAGDYATGSNHVLPTSGASRFRGGLSALDFVRIMSVQRLTRAGLARLTPTIVPLARAEGLEAHAESVEVRFS
ncbi:MAG: histidinol dehydrogenase [Blastocatellia bacterium]|nr:MAG: histidinol dehydrogenase [Blastocatellia bacterium]